MAPTWTVKRIPMVDGDYLGVDGLIFGNDVYRYCKQIDGRPEEGSFPIVTMRFIAFQYLRSRQFFYEAIGTYDDLFTAAWVNHQLRIGGAPPWAGHSLSVGLRMFESAYRALEGHLPLPQPGEPEIGKHRVRLTGGWKDSGEALQFANSWGRDWGDGGIGWLSREYANSYLLEAWGSRMARYGPTPRNSRLLLNAGSAGEFSRQWMAENPRQRLPLRFRGMRHVLTFFDTVALSDGCVGEVLEVHAGNGVRIGRAHLFHIAGLQPRTSVVKEFYVWPLFRGKGYGKLLDSLAVERAQAWHSAILRVELHEADVPPSSENTALLAAERCGYDCYWEKRHRPSILAIGEKAV